MESKYRIKLQMEGDENMRHSRRNRHSDESGFSSRRRLYRSEDAVFFGVCAGIAEHFDFSPWAVRFLLLILLFPAPWLIIAYIIAGCVLKKSPPQNFRNYETQEFWNVYQESRSEALRKVKNAFDSLDKRMQRMEEVVVDPNFDLRDEFRKL